MIFFLFVFGEFSMDFNVCECVCVGLFCIKKLAGNLWIIEYLKHEYVSIQNDGKNTPFHSDCV